MLTKFVSMLTEPRQERGRGRGVAQDRFGVAGDRWATGRVSEDERRGGAGEATRAPDATA
ncbi:MAG: hypothetical protein JWO86_5481 [Myxococcaceae bacterium]|nr:hypothetical protein [Myxococcaceae bacterium]